MKTLKNLLLVLACALAACTGVEKTSNKPEVSVVSLGGDTHKILVTNYGYYLFNCVPLGSGGQGDGKFALFSNNVNLKSAMQVFEAECKRLGVNEIASLQARPHSTCFFSWVPYVGSTLGLYWYKDIQISAVVSIANSKEQEISK